MLNVLMYINLSVAFQIYFPLMKRTSFEVDPFAKILKIFNLPILFNITA